MMPRAGFQHRAPGECFVSLVPIEQQQLAVPTLIQIVPADAQVIARNPHISIGAAREKVARDGTFIVWKTIPDPALDAIDTAEPGNLCGNSPARKMRRPIASRLLSQAAAFRSRQIKRDPVFVTSVMISDCVDTDACFL